MKKFIIAYVLINLVLFTYAECQDVDLEKIVVTPFRTEVSSGYNQTNLEIVENTNWGKRNNFDLGESLSLITGLDVVGGGKFGSASEGIYIRGALTRHTAYMLEGIKIYDPSNPYSYYVPADFLTSGLKKIEIVKAPLSAIYGSSPMGGAINFFVKRPQGKPYVYYEQSAGSFSTTKEELELGGKKDDVSYLFNIARLDSKGFSKAKEKNNNPEDDAYQDTNFTFKVDYNPDEKLETGVVTRVSHSRTENDEDDDYNGLPEDDLNNISWNDELFNTIYLKQKLFPMLTYKLQAGLTSIYRRYSDDKDSPIHNDNYVSAWYRGDTYQLGSNIEFLPSDKYKAILGYDYTHEKADSYRYEYSYAYSSSYTSDFPKHSNHLQGIFIEQIINPTTSCNMNISYRVERNPLFKKHDVIKGSLLYTLPKLNTDLYTSYSEGFKAPSLYQLYAPGSGNRNLKPEESKQWEIGLRQPIRNIFTFSAAYFDTTMKNLIDWAYTDRTFSQGLYQNVAKGKSRGVEIKSELQANENLKFNAGYTYTHAKQDYVADDSLTIFHHSTIRIPKRKAFFGANWKYKKFETLVDMVYIGTREDRIWVGLTSEFAKMKPYWLLNFSLNYNLKDNATIYLKINNIFDKDYERIKGYQEEKTAVYGGLKIKF